MRMAMALAGALFAAAAAQADEVVLRNGDRLSGTLLHLAQGRLTLRTPYADKLELDWSDVAAASTDAPVVVVRRGDARPLRLRLGPGLAPEEIVLLNPEPHESGLGTTYSGRATLAASYVRGNSESERLYADGQLSARARRYRYELSGRIERRDDPLAGSSLAWLASGNHDRFVSERRFVYGRASLEHDLAKDIERRAALGAGYGAQLLDAPAASVSLRGGLDYVVAERTLGGDERYPAFGWALKAEASPWRLNVRLFHEHEGFWDLHDASRLFIRSKTGLRMPLVERLAATAQLNVDWEREPAPGRKPTDTTLLLGLDYSW